jgi:hypothetical protein
LVLTGHFHGEGINEGIFYAKQLILKLILGSGDARRGEGIWASRVAADLTFFVLSD